MDELTITPHSIATFKSRAKLASAVAAVDEIRRLYAQARYAGLQSTPKGRGFRHGRKLKARSKSTEVTIWQVIEGAQHWVFYVRGRVLLTVHLHVGNAQKSV